MITKANSVSSEYEQSRNLLLKLHNLALEGRDESAEADAIRDEMDGPWYRLTEEQARRLRNLSADLATLEPDSPIKHPTSPNIYSESLADSIHIARTQGDYDEVLNLLRMSPSQVSADRAAALRGACYEALGEQETALLFVEYAVRVSSVPDSYAIFLLIKLIKSGRLERAVAWAKELCQTIGNPSPHLLEMLATTFFDSGKTTPGETGRDFLRQAIRLFQQAHDKVESLLIDPRQKLLAVNCQIGIAVCHCLLSDHELAIAALDVALQIDPKDETALTIRGLLKGPADWSAAIEDLTKAIGSHSASVWPYYYVAYDLLRRSEFERCLETCAAGLRLSSDPEINSDLCEWMAISHAELGSPAKTIVSCFEDALAFSPHNERVARNFRRFSDSLADRPSAARNWVIAQEIEPQYAARVYMQAAPPRVSMLESAR
jgi:tetratricopeptide (TPR) repeat protein